MEDVLWDVMEIQMVYLTCVEEFDTMLGLLFTLHVIMPKHNG
jgi:hypothetical protein